VAAVIVSSHLLDLVAWGLNAVVFAAVAVIPPGARSPVAHCRQCAQVTSGN
jgi:hypothetical protein